MLLKKRGKKALGSAGPWASSVIGSVGTGFRKPTPGPLAGDGALKTGFGNWSSTCLRAALVSSCFPRTCGQAVSFQKHRRDEREIHSSDERAEAGSSGPAGIVTGRTESAAAAGLWESKGRDARPSPASGPVRHGPKKPSQLQMQTFGYSCLHLLMPLLSHHRHRDNPAKVCRGQTRRRR